MMISQMIQFETPHQWVNCYREYMEHLSSWVASLEGIERPEEKAAAGVLMLWLTSRPPTTCSRQTVRTLLQIVKHTPSKAKLGAIVMLARRLV